MPANTHCLAESHLCLQSKLATTGSRKLKKQMHSLKWSRVGNSMKKDEVALEIRDSKEVLWYSGKKHALIIYYITLFFSFFFTTWYIIN